MAILSISFAAPGMTEEWGLSKAALGVILPLELLGIALGSIWMGSFADNNGRRPIILISLVMITFGMLAAGIAPNKYVLGFARVFTGIGVGGMLATITATASDFCNALRSDARGWWVFFGYLSGGDVFRSAT